MTTTRMSVARNAFTKLSKNLKFSLRSRKLNSLHLNPKSIMLNRRMFDIVTQESSASSSSSRRNHVSEFGQKRLIHDWVRMVLRIQLQFRYVRAKIAVESMLGHEDFDDMILNQNVRRIAMSSTTQTQIQEREIVRTAKVNGQVFILGEALVPYQDNHAAVADPLQCDHPNDELRLLGNKTAKSVYCRMCHRRWKRIDVNEFQMDFGEVPRDNHVLNYGKYMTWTYLEAYREDYDYCTWTLQTADMNSGTDHESTGALKHFAQYIFLKDSGELPRPTQQLMEARPEIRNAMRTGRNRRIQVQRERNVPGGLLFPGGATVTHLPDMERSGQDATSQEIPLSIPPSTTDRRRTIAEADTVHDVAGDVGMEAIGTDGWEFPLEPLPRSI